MRRLWPLPGGITPPSHKTLTASLPISGLPPASQLVLPLYSAKGPNLLPVVSAGDLVRKGQLLADSPDPLAVPLHAPTSGLIQAITQPALHSCLILEPDGQGQWIALTPCDDYTQLTPSALIAKIRAAGIAGMGGAGFPCAQKLSAQTPVHTLIVNGCESEPYGTADDSLMREAAADIVAGAQLLAFITGAQTLLMAVEDDKPQAIATLQAATLGTAVEVVAVPSRYPTGGDKQLVYCLTGIEVPSQHYPIQAGVLVQNVATVQAAWRAVRYGEPLIERVTTFTGQALSRPANLRLPMGTPLQHALTQLGWNPIGARLISGGPLMGAPTDPSAPLLKTTQCIIAASPNELPNPAPEQPCIRCSYCSDACPVSLQPQQLLLYSLAVDVGQLQTLNLFDCIECGACDYVCPSNIPLVSHFQQAKQQIRQEEEQLARANRARTRFQNRNARLARQESEKAAKRQQRQLAAQTAKAALAERAENPADANQGSTDLVAAAMARVAQRAQDPAEQQARLARNLSSAEARLVRAQTQLSEVPSNNPQRREKYSAALKQAERNLSEAQQKLAEFTQNPAPAILQKLTASPAASLQASIATLHKHLAVAQQKLAEAERDQKPTAAALRNGVEKLQQRLQQAEAEAQNLPPSATQAPTPDPATLAAADRVLAKLAAKQQQSPAQKQAALRESIQKRITQLETRIATEPDSEALPALQGSLASLREKLGELG